MSSDDRDPVDLLAEDFADRVRRGEHPSVSDYAAAHPEHATQLTAVLPAVAHIEILKRFRALTTPTGKSLPDRLGDFRIVRELGRGGMGVVFEAVQESLGRPVALKILARHAQLDAMRRERFMREAHAAAKLHHTNIVPVFGVGEQDGLPYYVMQLIPGYSLHSLLRQWRIRQKEDEAAEHETHISTPDTAPDHARPQYEVVEPEATGPEYGDWRFVADVGIQAAHALHYAHKHGVLHRDMKPANLMLDGEIIWVTDFGLAKLKNVEGLTETGEILGTLQYLPPECLAGDADPRSDVYGLGATLYELITLKMPYTGDSPARLLKQVADTDPPPPRELNPDVPRDLETIVMKAMNREPSARYGSAREMARDLEAFLDDRPIKARRISQLARAWRWCRRNRAVSILAFSTVAALLLGTLTGWIGFARSEARRKDAEDATRTAEHATDEARQMSDRLEANLRLSLETFDTLFNAVGGSRQLNYGIPLSAAALGEKGPERRPPEVSPDLTSDKAAILEAILDFYDKFAKQNAPNPELQFEAAKAYRRVSDANMQLQRTEKAVPAFRRAVMLMEPLVARFPDNDEQRTELIATYLNAPPEAYPTDRDAPLRRAAELDRGSGWLSGVVKLRIAMLSEQANDRAAAATAYNGAITSFTSIPFDKRPPFGPFELAFARFRLAQIRAQQSDYSSARMMLETSIDELRPALGFDSSGRMPRPRPGSEWLPKTYGELAKVCRAMNDDRAAAEAEATAMRLGGSGMKKDGPKKDGPPPRKR